VEVSQLSHSFGTRRALDGVSFAVEPAEVFGLLGPNGGGCRVRKMQDLVKMLSIQIRCLMEQDLGGGVSYVPAFAVLMLVLGAAAVERPRARAA
jgi:ABC-type uncharacterized transport system ATPase subunit